RARDLGGVEAAADVHERASFASERVSLLVGESVGMREPLRDFAIAVELREVFRRRDDGERPRVTGGRLADVHELHAAAGRGREALEVADRLVVRRELVVRADREAEDRLWSGNRALLCRGSMRACNCEKKRSRARDERVRADTALHQCLPAVGFRATACYESYGFLGSAVRGGGDDGGDDDGLDAAALPLPAPEFVFAGDVLVERGVAVPVDPLPPCV